MVELFRVKAYTDLPEEVWCYSALYSLTGVLGPTAKPTPRESSGVGDDSLRNGAIRCLTPSPLSPDVH